MHSGTKIVVLRIREIIYTFLLLFLAAILIVCLVIMFGGKKNAAPNASLSETSGSSAADTSLSEAADSSGTNSSLSEAADSSGTIPSLNESSDNSGTAAALSEQAGTSSSAAAASNAVKNSPPYTAGVYLASVNLGNSAAEVEVTVDQNRILAIRLVNLTEELDEAYPLVSSSLEAISEQILDKQSLDGITAPMESRYTSQLLLNAISDALEAAQN